MARGRANGSQDRSRRRWGAQPAAECVAKAVRTTSPLTKIVIHVANDGGLSGAEAFFVNVDPVVDFDCIGLSYYPCWHGTLADLRTITHTLSARHRKPIIIAETAYAYTSANADSQGNSWAGTDPTGGGFEVSVQGQATAIRDIMAAVSDVPRDAGLGTFYWEPDWIPVAGAGWITGQGDGWENQAWWDFNGKQLDSMWTYRLVSESPGEQVPATITSIPTVDVQTTVGTAPVLPATVGAFFSDASYNQASVTRSAVSPSQYAAAVFGVENSLAAGTYSYSAWMMGDGTPVSLDIYADNGTKATAAVTNTGWQQRHQYTISGITVGASGQLVIALEGNMTGGDWGKLDDVTVTRQ